MKLNLMQIVCLNSTLSLRHVQVPDQILGFRSTSLTDNFLSGPYEEAREKGASICDQGAVTQQTEKSDFPKPRKGTGNIFAGRGLIACTIKKGEV